MTTQTVRRALEAFRRHQQDRRTPQQVAIDAAAERIAAELAAPAPSAARGATAADHLAARASEAQAAGRWAEAAAFWDAARQNAPSAAAERRYGGLALHAQARALIGGAA